jgi:hypothetical protein
MNRNNRQPSIATTKNDPTIEQIEMYTIGCVSPYLGDTEYIRYSIINNMMKQYARNPRKLH